VRKEKDREGWTQIVKNGAANEKGLRRNASGVVYLPLRQWLHRQYDLVCHMNENRTLINCRK
jgi:hypothetical protein